MKFLFIIAFSFSSFAGSPVLTPPNDGSSGCNVQYHLGLEDRQEFLIFHDNLVKLVDRNNVEELSKVVAYPLNFSSKKKLSINNKKEFIENYKLIFNKKIKNIIKKQDRNKFFCKSSGLMYGRGEIWVNNFNKQKKLKIITVNQK